MPWPRLTPTNAAAVDVVARATRPWPAQVAWSPNGRLLAVACAEGVFVYPGGLAQAPIAVGAHDGPVKGVSFAPNSATLASASADTFVRVWDLRAAAPTARPLVAYAHGGAAERVAYAPQGNMLASCGADRAVQLRHGGRAQTLSAHTDEVLALAWHPNGRVLASGGRDGGIALWDATDGQPLAFLQGHTDWVRVLAFAPDGTLWSASRDKTARRWDAAAQRATTLLPQPADARAMALAPDGALLAVGAGPEITLWDAAADTQTPRATLHAHTHPVVGLAFHPQGGLLASAGGDNALRLWGLPTGAASHEDSDT